MINLTHNTYMIRFAVIPVAEPCCYRCALKLIDFQIHLTYYSILHAMAITSVEGTKLLEAVIYFLSSLSLLLFGLVDVCCDLQIFTIDIFPASLNFPRSFNYSHFPSELLSGDSFLHSLLLFPEGWKISALDFKCSLQVVSGCRTLAFIRGPLSPLWGFDYRYAWAFFPSPRETTFSIYSLLVVYQRHSPKFIIDRGLLSPASTFKPPVSKFRTLVFSVPLQRSLFAH